MPRPASPRWLRPLAVGAGCMAFVVLLWVCYLFKRHFGVSVSNITLSLLVPLGPMLLGSGVLGAHTLMSLRRADPNDTRLGLEVAALGLLAICSDQYFAYLTDAASATSFGEWYSYTVEHRSLWIRGQGTVANHVGGLGYALEMLKLVGLFYPAYMLLSPASPPPTQHPRTARTTLTPEDHELAEMEAEMDRALLPCLDMILREPAFATLRLDKNRIRVELYKRAAEVFSDATEDNPSLRIRKGDLLVDSAIVRAEVNTAATIARERLASSQRP